MTATTHTDATPRTVTPTRYVGERNRLRRAVDERLGTLPVWVLLIQAFIGMGWIRAATEKAIDPTWWSGEYLLGFLADHDGDALGWYQPFLDLFVEPGAVSMSYLVFGLQLAVGLMLVLGKKVPWAPGLGMFMNLNFIAAGAVDPSIFYVLAQGAVALWLAERAGLASLERLRLAAIGAMALAIMSVPYVATLHPADVIHDPAIILVTAGLLALVSAELLHRRASADTGLP